MLKWSSGELFTLWEGNILPFWSRICFLSLPPHFSSTLHHRPFPFSSSSIASTTFFSPPLLTLHSLIESWFSSQYVLGLESVDPSGHRPSLHSSGPWLSRRPLFSMLSGHPWDGLLEVEGNASETLGLCQQLFFDISIVFRVKPRVSHILNQVHEWASNLFLVFPRHPFELWKCFLIYIFFDCICKGLLAWQPLLWEWYWWLVLLAVTIIKRIRCLFIYSQCGTRFPHKAHEPCSLPPYYSLRSTWRASKL